MASAAGKKNISLSLFMEAKGLEVEEELSTMATPRGSNVETGKGRAGSVMCETRVWV